MAGICLTLGKRREIERLYNDDTQREAKERAYRDKRAFVKGDFTIKMKSP